MDSASLANSKAWGGTIALSPRIHLMSIRSIRSIEIDQWFINTR